MRPDRFLAAVTAALVLMGCPGKIVEPGDGGAGGGSGGGVTGGGGGTTGGGAGGGGEPDAGPTYARSAKANLRFKGDLRLTIDFAVGLGLPLDQVCAELGQYQCTTFVHPVALGGVDPYGKGLYEALPVTGVTTPAVVDRVALAACVRRVDLDLATPASAVIFKSIPVTAGKLTNPAGAEARLALTELAQRAWLRDPTEAELQHFIKLATDVEATGVADPAKRWMQAACFAAFTSVESIFY